jgi:hypothetical protein
MLGIGQMLVQTHTCMALLELLQDRHHRLSGALVMISGGRMALKGRGEACSIKQY